MLVRHSFVPGWAGLWRVVVERTIAGDVGQSAQLDVRALSSRNLTAYPHGVDASVGDLYLEMSLKFDSLDVHWPDD